MVEEEQGGVTHSHILASSKVQAAAELVHDQRTAIIWNDTQPHRFHSVATSKVQAAAGVRHDRRTATRWSDTQPHPCHLKVAPACDLQAAGGVMRDRRTASKLLAAAEWLLSCHK